MGRRKGRARRKELWIAAGELPKSAGHPFYQRLSELLDEHDFDLFAEGLCEKFYAAALGRPSLTPGVYFRCLRIGYFEGMDSERASLGVSPTRCRCGVFSRSRSTNKRRIIRRSRARGD